jgi:orotidine-5'-phosphate decarboxylase
MVNPILVALDTGDISAARALANRLIGRVGGFKVGLELLMSEGPTAVTQIAELGAPVFADAKLHDIPNTVRKAAYELAKHRARWVTIHASGGADMVSAAVTGLREGSSGREAGILAVTVLTSLDEDDLAATGISRSVDAQVRELSLLALRNGAEGVVCSPNEALIVKDASDQLLVVTPGIRMSSRSRQDQKRVTTPSSALSNGADLLVIGRAITEADDPERAVDEIVDSLQSENSI